MPTKISGSEVFLVFGAGGHGRVVADAVLRSGSRSRLVASDRDVARCVGELLPGVPLHVAAYFQDSDGPVHVAIGDNAAREKESRAFGLQRLVTVTHPQASISPYSVVSAGCFIAARAVVAPGANLASGVIVNHGAVLDHDVTVSAFTHIAPGSILGGGAWIGARVLVGSGAVVQAGRHVCDGAVIGAGAVVCTDVTEVGTYVGMPARRIR